MLGTHKRVESTRYRARLNLDAGAETTMNYRDPKTGKLKWRKLSAFSLIIVSVLSYLYVIGYIKLLREHRFLRMSTDPPKEEVFFHLPSSAGYKALFFFYYPIIKSTSDGVIWV